MKTADVSIRAVVGGERCMDGRTYMYIQATAKDARKERRPQATSISLSFVKPEIIYYSAFQH
jgi:hypothetical protein